MILIERKGNRYSKSIPRRMIFLWTTFRRNGIRSIFNQHFKWEFKIKYRETSISEYPSKQIREISEIINFFILNYIKIFEIGKNLIDDRKERQDGSQHSELPDIRNIIDHVI